MLKIILLVLFFFESLAVDDNKAEAAILDFSDIDGVRGSATLVPSDVWNGGSKTIAGFGGISGVTATVTSTSTAAELGNEAYFVLGAGTDFLIRSDNNPNTGVTGNVTFSMNTPISGSIAKITYFGDAGIPEGAVITVSGSGATITDTSSTSSTAGNSLTYSSANSDGSFQITTLLTYSNVTSITFTYSCVPATSCGSVFEDWFIDETLINLPSPSNDPVVAFEAIKTEIESITKNGLISNSVEQVKTAEFIMREKMVFHGEMMRAEPSTATTSFVDYNFNLNGNSFGMVGDGKYHQTDIVGDQFRRRIMIDAKRVHSRNESVTQVVSALSLFDVGISEKTSSQYRFGFKQSDGKGNHPIKSFSKARAYRVGASLSHSFNEKVFGGIFGDLIYTQTKSSFRSTYTNVIGKMRTYSVSGGAQLTGQYGIYPELWIKPTLALSYSREYLIRKRFVSTTSLGSAVVEAALPMPTVFRITVEPEFLYESFANQNGIKDFVSVNPSYACENMKSGNKIDACNTGVYFQIGKKNDEKGITGKFYFSYENLNSGPKHEYGLQFKSNF
ncbi:hypothetical protein [Candidatus Ponderosibacter sp. Uisw_141_02]|uniref:hypothetical protein n=1 Tax=Candidatus Ponderosibacter sp. Uisw_141_02 TaxID=3231000 RepID=UPI003D5B2326